MQLFIYSVLMLLIYGYNKFAGYMAIAWSMIASFAYTMVMTYIHQYHNINQVADTLTNNDYTNTLYISPLSRAPPYLYGLLLGILYTNYLFKEKQKGEHMFIRMKRKFQ